MAGPPRSRMIHPRIWTDEKFIELSDFDRLNFIALISLADDDGRHRNNSRALKARIRPADDGQLSDISQSLDRLQSAGFIVMDDVSIQLVNWEKHQKQRADRRFPSDIPIVTDNVRQMSDECQTNVGLSEVKLSEVKPRESEKEKSKQVSPKRNTRSQNQIKFEKSVEQHNKIKFGDYMWLSTDQYGKLCKDFGDSLVEREIERMNNWFGMDVDTRQYKYSSQYHFARNWLNDKKDKAQKDEPQKSKSPQVEDLMKNRKY